MTLYGTIKEIKDFEFNEDLLAMVNDIYLESRYPGEIGLLDDGSMPTMEQARQFFAFAKEVETKIKGELNEELRGKPRGIEDFSLKSLRMRGNTSPAPPVGSAPRGGVLNP